MKELVQLLARHLVNDPDAVDVTETQGQTTSLLELRVALGDRGRVIGKRGRTAESMRILLSAVAARANRKAILNIIEE